MRHNAATIRRRKAHEPDRRHPRAHAIDAAAGQAAGLIAGEPMIVHVWRRAVAAGVGPVVVACAEHEIAAAVARGGRRAPC